MKYLTCLKKFALGATGVLSVTIFYGLYAQIILGFYQLGFALLLLFFMPEFSKKNKKKLLFYLGVLLLYGLVCLKDWGNTQYLNTIATVLYAILIPLSLIIFFIIILELSKPKKL